MGALDRFVLPEDVVLTPVGELPDDLREGFAHGEGDCAVTRPMARGSSTVVDAESASLLERFREPTTIVEAVIAYSKAEGVSPDETLDAAFGMLSGLVADGLLVAADSKLAEPIATSLAAGDRVGAFELVEAVHVIVDSEVHLARASDGAAVAIKVARPGFEHGLGDALAREATFLQRLDGTAGPRLLDAGHHDEQPFLAVSWCPGVDVLAAAGLARELEPEAARAELLRLGEQTIAAYARLHAAGVLHGDVHPRNVLADPDGEVALIDFGFAAEAEPAAGPPTHFPRAGVDFFLEPEAAAARLAGAPPVPASVAGEQYAVAALVYLLLSGGHTQDFSLEPEEMLRQLRDRPPLPFAERGCRGFDAAEAVLARALAKGPTERFPAIADFLLAFRVAAAEDRDRAMVASESGRPERLRLLDEVLERLAAPDGELFADGIPAPTASVQNGAAGFALALLRIAGLRGDPELLALADLWAVRARLAAGSEEAFWNAELEITPETFGESSLFHNRAGIHCVEALIAAARDDEGAARQSLHEFAAATDPCEKVDVAFGKAGLLLGAAILREALPGLADPSGLCGAGDALRDALWAELGAQPPLDREPGLDSLGAAHGWAGHLLALLRWSEADGGPPPEGLVARLEQLLAQARPLGRGLCWPHDAGGRLSHTALEASWCNGSAGQVFLWATAADVLGDERWERPARLAAWNAFESPPPSIGDLCCGWAGRAYALLRLHRRTGEEAWLARARLLADRAATAVRDKPLRRDSLYKGEVGVALLAAELEQPAQARMPLFEG
ncbi:MAG: lanthionine synthetase LanC family protein [Solirubrobacterales bacterium]